MGFLPESIKSRRGTVVILIIVLILGLWWFRSGQINTWKITNLMPPAGSEFDTNIMAFGDSLTAGNGASGPSAYYVTGVGTALGETVVNSGVAGDTSASALARVAEVLAQRPRVLILLLGGNDILQRVPLETTTNNLDSIIEAFQEQGTMVVLVGIQAPYIGRKYGPAFRDLARRRGCVYVPNILGGILGKPSLMADQIHPNDSGYVKVAERIVKGAGPFIKEALAAH